VKVHLVDGTYELFRVFYGAPSRQAPDGSEVGATRALLGTLLRLVTDEGASHIGIAFDTVIESFRNQLFSGYKTGDGIDPDLWGQFELAERAAHALGMVVWSMREFEADDALATAASKYADQVDQVVICSPDKDMAQCIRQTHVVSYDRMRKKLRDEAGVIEKFGVPPKSIPDWLALVGDSADGIPGIPRWGTKGAGTVLARYGHVSDIPSDPANWDIKVRGAATMSRTLEAARNEAMLYVELATLRCDVPLEENLADLEWRGGRRDELQQLCQEIGMRPDFLDRIPRWR